MPERDWLGMHVPEAKNYQLVYELDLDKLGPDIHWDVDNREQNSRALSTASPTVSNSETPTVLPSDVYVSMDAFTDSLDKIGVPTFQSGAHFQQNVAHLNVFSDVQGHHDRHQPGRRQHRVLAE